MRFLRHKTGGRIDETSEACEFSTLDKTSQILHKSSVWSSHLTGTTVRDSTVTGSIIKDSIISHTLITGGNIENSKIYAELVADYACIKNSFAGAGSRIVHTAYLENVRVKNLTVSGDARLVGWHNDENFDGQECYISRGIWTRPPRILRLPEGLTITESIPGFAYCGCKFFSISHWLKIGDRYGKVLGLSAENVDSIRQFLISLTASQKDADTNSTHRPQP